MNIKFRGLNQLNNNIPKGNGKKRPLGIASYEDKIVQMAVKKILGAIYEPRFLNCMVRPQRRQVGVECGYIVRHLFSLSLKSAPSAATSTL